MNKEKARKLSLEEILALPRGAVIWCEADTEYVDFFTGERLPEYDCYTVVPMLISISGENGKLCCIDRTAIWEYDITESLPQEMMEKGLTFWDREPLKEQITPGFTPVDEWEGNNNGRQGYE